MHNFQLLNSTAEPAEHTCSLLGFASNLDMRCFEVSRHYSESEKFIFGRIVLWIAVKLHSDQNWRTWSLPVWRRMVGGRANPLCTQHTGNGRKSVGLKLLPSANRGGRWTATQDYPSSYEITSQRFGHNSRDERIVLCISWRRCSARLQTTAQRCRVFGATLKRGLSKSSARAETYGSGRR